VPRCSESPATRDPPSGWEKFAQRADSLLCPSPHEAPSASSSERKFIMNAFALVSLPSLITPPIAPVALAPAVPEPEPEKETRQPTDSDLDEIAEQEIRWFYSRDSRSTDDATVQARTTIQAWLETMDRCRCGVFTVVATVRSEDRS